MKENPKRGLFSRVRAMSDDASEAISDVRTSADQVRESVDILVLVLSALLVVSAATLIVVSTRPAAAS